MSALCPIPSLGSTNLIDCPNRNRIGFQSWLRGNLDRYFVQLDSLRDVMAPFSKCIQ